MVNHKRAVACLVGMAAVAGGTARGDDVFWVSEFSESWHNGFNWSTGSPPAPGDAAFIEVAEDVVVTHSQGATLVDVLSCEERFRLVGASSLGFSGDGKFSEVLTIETTGGLFTELASSGISLLGLTNFNAGEIGGSGSIINGGMMTISGAGEKIISAVFENNALGSINLQQDTLLLLDLHGGAFVNRGLFDQHGDIILINGRIDNLNDGVFHILTTTFPTIHGRVGAAFNNAGLLQIMDGTVGTFNDIVLNNTAMIEVNSGATMIFDGGAALVNSGKVNQHGDVMLANGQITNTKNGTYAMITDTMPTITGNGVDTMFDNAGDFFGGSGTQASLSDMFFNNTGSVEISPDGQVSFNDVLFDNSGMINVQAGGMMILICIELPVTNSGSVHVAGTLSLTGKAPTSYQQTAGSTMLDLGTIMAEGTVDIQGGEVAGIGSINGELLLGCPDAVGASSPGFVALADPRPSPLCPDCTGVIDVIGDFTQCEFGELEIAFYEPVGAKAGDGSVHDRLAVSAVATLGGKLTVTLDGPFDPLDDAVFDVLTAEAIQGEFSEVQVPILPGDRTFEVIYNANAVQLRVVDVAACPRDLNPDGTVGPCEFSAFRGFYDSGSLGSLLESDDNKLCYNPGIVLNPTEAPITLDFTGTLPNDSPATLDVTIESSANTVGLELTFSFWNFNTNSWDVVGTATQSLNDDMVRTFAGNPVEHVEPVTGEVRTRYEVRQAGIVFVFPWLDCVDHVFWTITD